MKKKILTIICACALPLFAIAQETTQSSKPASLRFDFGSGEVAEGFIGVTATTAYSEILGYGFEDGCASTLEQVGNYFNVTRERIRQIESKAKSKLRNSKNRKMLEDFIDNNINNINNN